MTDEVFVDASFWMAMLNRRDAYHALAIQVQQPARIVTTRAVQLEVMDAFSGKRARGLAMQFWQLTSNNPNLLIIPLDDALLNQAVVLFQSRPDKDWSLTDCVSFVVMQQRGITAALTTDHHFEQAGFTCLLKKP